MRVCVEIERCLYLFAFFPSKTETARKTINMVSLLEGLARFWQKGR